MNIFDPAEIARFKETGYLVGRDILPRATCEAVQAHLLDAVKCNLGPGGWKEAMLLLHDCVGDDRWLQLQTARLKAALDQLLGEGRWLLPSSFGSWPILFPGFSEPPWEPIEMSWHVEGRTYLHRLDSREIGVTMIMLFSDIAPGDGGTAIMVGSHREVARILSRAADGMAQMELTGAFMSAGARGPIVEAIGRAGDILFMHPFTVHATSRNIGRTVRLACNCRAALKEPLRVASVGSELSPVEEAIADAIDTAHGRPPFDVIDTP